ncbi:MAG TPA: lysylphosphatidylglycerol synthase domain-containing protein [Nitrososphaerales archaeon]|nr:lysylphosphatidylglycerol synthase domain-containing protein [Nitrososphaerales archaeon]
MSRGVLRWVAMGLVLSSAVVLIISLYSGVKFTDFERVGYLTFGLAGAASAARLLVQVLRFRVITTGLAGNPNMDLSGLAIARVSSEFISISTPASSAGVFLRSAWLAKKGVTGGTALWIGYYEVLIEIYVGVGLGVAAAVYALSKGAIVLGSTIAVIALVLITAYTVVFIIPARRAIKVPHFVFTLAEYLVGGPRATAFYLRAVVGSLNFSISARAILTRRTVPVMLKAVLLTIVEDILGGVALWLVLSAVGLKIDLLSAIIAAYGVATVAQLPITIGGAGVTELTMQAYLTAVYGFSSWAAIVIWRVATYQVLLALTGIVFVFFVRSATAQPEHGAPAVKS